MLFSSSRFVCPRKIAPVAIFLSFSEMGLFLSQNAKVPLHLETFPFGEKIRVNEKLSNPRAQISLDEWL